MRTSRLALTLHAALTGGLCCWSLAAFAADAAATPSTPPASPTVYRCGSSYSDAPCPGGHPVDAKDPRSADQRRQAAEVLRRDQALARQQAAERQRLERNRAVQTRPIGEAADPVARQADRRGKGRSHASAGTATRKTKGKAQQRASDLRAMAEPASAPAAARPPGSQRGVSRPQR